jgi:hypothetical protein
VAHGTLPIDGAEPGTTQEALFSKP